MMDAVHKDDAVSYFKASSEKFAELAALFKVLMKNINEHDDNHALAKLGWGVALDWANLTDCWREELKEGGFRQ